MLPPGHIAAGFLTAKVLLNIVHPSLTADQQTQLLWWGMFFGFAPDLDTFVAFAKAKAFVFINKDETNHRKYYSHAPVLWLIAGLIVVAVAPNTYWRYVGLLLWLGSWSHFLLDTVQYGIMWLWPLSTKIYAFSDTEKKLNVVGIKFLDFWWSFVKLYSKTVSFYLEILIIIVSLISM